MVRRAPFHSAVSLPVILAVGFLWQPLVVLAQEKAPAKAQEKAKRSLYARLGEVSEERLGGQRLGGAYKIAAIVSDLVDRLEANEVIRANPQIKRISAPAMAGHKFEFTLMLCSRAGGPQRYAGRSLAEAHSGLTITQKEWQAMLDELKGVLEQHKVPAAEQAEFIALIESTRKDIVRQ
jgi:hemoglobin